MGDTYQGMGRLERLRIVLSDFQDGIEDHLMSQLEEERPDDADTLRPQVKLLAQKIADAAAVELVDASYSLQALYETRLRRFIRRCIMVMRA